MKWIFQDALKRAMGASALVWCHALVHAQSTQLNFAFDNWMVAAPDSISSIPGTFNPADGPPGSYLGPGYTASLFFLNGVVTNWPVFDTSDPALFAPADTPYYGDGYFDPEDVYLTPATNRTVTVQVRAWYNGHGAYTNYAQASAAGHNVGESNPVEIIMAIGSQDPTR